MSNITPEMATRELKRRALKTAAAKAKGRSQAVKDGTFGMQKFELMVLAGQEAPKGLAKPKQAPKPKAPAKPKLQPKAATDARKAAANAAFKLAFDKAPEGSKRKAGKKAYGAVMNGATLEQVKNALARI